MNDVQFSQIIGPFELGFQNIETKLFELSSKLDHLAARTRTVIQKISEKAKDQTRLDHEFLCAEQPDLSQVCTFYSTTPAAYAKEITAQIYSKLKKENIGKILELPLYNTKIRFMTQYGCIKRLTQIVPTKEVGSGTYKIIKLALRIEYERTSLFSSLKRKSFPSILAHVKAANSNQTIRDGLNHLASLWSKISEERRSLFVPPPSHIYETQECHLEFVQPYYPDGDLATADIPLEKMLGLFLQAIQAIKTTHEYQVVHGDSRFANFLIGRDGLHLNDWDKAAPQFLSKPYSFHDSYSVCFLRGLFSYEVDGYLLISSLFCSAFKEKAELFLFDRTRFFTSDLEQLILRQCIRMTKNTVANNPGLAHLWEELDQIVMQAKWDFRRITYPLAIAPTLLTHQSIQGISHSIRLIRMHVASLAGEKIKAKVMHDIDEISVQCWKEFEKRLGQIAASSKEIHVPDVDHHAPLEELITKINIVKSAIETKIKSFEEKMKLHGLIDSMSSFADTLLRNQIERIKQTYPITINSDYWRTSYLDEINTLVRLITRKPECAQYKEKLDSIAPQAQKKFEKILQKVEAGGVNLKPQFAILEKIAYLMREAAKVDQFILNASTEEPALHEARYGNEANAKLALFFTNIRPKVVEKFGRNCLDAATLYSIIKEWLSPTG